MARAVVVQPPSAGGFSIVDPRLKVSSLSHTVGAATGCFPKLLGFFLLVLVFCPFGLFRDGCAVLSFGFCFRLFSSLLPCLVDRLAVCGWFLVFLSCCPCLCCVLPLSPHSGQRNLRPACLPFFTVRKPFIASLYLEVFSRVRPALLALNLEPALFFSN